MQIRLISHRQEAQPSTLALISSVFSKPNICGNETAELEKGEGMGIRCSFHDWRGQENIIPYDFVVIDSSSVLREGSLVPLDLS